MIQAEAVVPQQVQAEAVVPYLVQAEAVLPIYIVFKQFFFVLKRRKYILFYYQTGLKFFICVLLTQSIFHSSKVDSLRRKRQLSSLCTVLRHFRFGRPLFFFS